MISIMTYIYHMTASIYNKITLWWPNNGFLGILIKHRDTVRFICGRKVRQTSDLGHCWPGTISFSDQELLQGCRRSPAGLWHHKSRDLQCLDKLADRRADPGQSKHRHRVGGQQEGSGTGERGHLPGGQQICPGKWTHVFGNKCPDWRKCGRNFPQMCKVNLDKNRIRRVRPRADGLRNTVWRHLNPKDAKRVTGTQ